MEVAKGVRFSHLGRDDARNASISGKVRGQNETRGIGTAYHLDDDTARGLIFIVFYEKSREREREREKDYRRVSQYAPNILFHFIAPYYLSVIWLLIRPDFSAGSPITAIKIEIPNIRRIIITNCSPVISAFLITR